jgi:Cullin family
MVIFKYIDDKEAFQEIYSKMLAKRLVQNTASADAEAFMISKLEQACVFAPRKYTGKLRSMIESIGVNENLNEEFKKLLPAPVEPLDIDFNIQVRYSVHLSLNGLKHRLHVDL